MDLTYLSKTDKELLVIAIEQSSAGKEARREITRRRLVHYSDGTARLKIDAKAEIVEPESRVGVITINGVQQ
jgi:hypothetical protein